MNTQNPYDVAVVGAGPAGLSAALILGRSRNSVALFDTGPPRNAAAGQVHGFVTRDAASPAEFRREAREQLRPYDRIDVFDVAVEAITREGERFTVRAGSVQIAARRVLLAVGVIDELPDLPGYRELWGQSVFQCPYCHAWEVSDRPFGLLATSVSLVEFSLLLAGWSRDLVVFTGGDFALPDELRARLEAARIRVEERPIRALRARDGRLEAVELVDGDSVPREVLFSRPDQRQIPLVKSLGLAVNDEGYVRVDDRKRTSIEGIYAAGDLTRQLHSAVVAAAAGAEAAYMINHDVTLEAIERESAPRMARAA